MNQSKEQNSEIASSSSSCSSTPSSGTLSSSSDNMALPFASMLTSTAASTASLTSASTSTAASTFIAVRKEHQQGTKKIVSALKRKRNPCHETTKDEDEGSSSKKSRLDHDSSSSGEVSFAEKAKKKKRRVVFDGVTVFFFRRTQGFTSVPSQGGSTLGMAPKHETIGKFTLKQFELSQEKCHRAILRKQLMDRRCQQLRESSPCSTMTLREAESDLDEELDNININDYYFLQPIPTKQRRLLLKRSGVKKIDNTEKMELKRIRLSRESCGCDCQVVCDPETCMCSLAGIKCQVDRQSFPCGCSKDGCHNKYGRIEFNPSRVRNHFIQTVVRLDMEHRQDERMNPGGSRSQEDCFEGPPDMSSLSHPLEDWGHQASTSSSQMYSGSLNGRDFYGNVDIPLGDDRASCSSSLYSKSCDAYGSGNSLEENIPVEVRPPRQHDLIPQMLQFNESEDESAMTQPIAPLCNVPLPTMPCYDSSEDNFSSTSDSTSSSEASSNYDLNECSASFNMKSSADYNLASSLVQSSEVNSLSHSPTVEGTLPHLTPLEVANIFSTSKQTADNTNSKTYTELKQPDSYTNSSFSTGLYNPDNSAHSSYSEIFMPYDNTKVADSIPLTLPSLTTAPSAYTTCSSPSSSSTYTVMTSLNAVDSLAEMQETALATSKLSSVTFGMKDDPSSSFTPPEPLLYSSTTMGSVGDISSSFSVTPRCNENHGNEATATGSNDSPGSHQGHGDDGNGISPTVDSPGDAVLGNLGMPLGLCSSSEERPVFDRIDALQSQTDRESTDTCSVESCPGDHPLQESNIPGIPCCSTTSQEGEIISLRCNLEASDENISSNSKEFMNNTEGICQSESSSSSHPQPITHEDSQMKTEATGCSMPNDLVTCSGRVESEESKTTDSRGQVHSTVSSKPLPSMEKLCEHPLTNGTIPVLSHLPREVLTKDSAVELAKKIQVLRGNSEGEATPSISPDSLSPDGAMSDDPFRQAVDPSAIDESSFSSSDSAVGHMSSVGYSELSSGIPTGPPLVPAGISE
ncbi:uncharacterized protein LOC129257540 [Lytechinus pictus]|uniref:uncharacterized protein LOC129257540 n=1 Tax=Lytechinus pictus TaxID=7653 RepID=UPI0030B9EB69